jgi:hypothetical protein
MTRLIREKTQLRLAESKSRERHVKNSVSFKSKCYSESLGALVEVLQCIPLLGTLSSAVV